MTDFAIDPNGPLAYLNEKPVPKGPDNKLGKDAFLKLLVAQMKYQNPMEPADATDFIAQTAQFTLVEQMENMASANEDMLAGQRNATAASMVGKQVKWTVDGSDEAGSPGNGTVQGVRITADGPVLIVDGWDVPLSRVTAFGDVPEVGGGSVVTPPEDTGDPTSATDAATETESVEAIEPVTEETGSENVTDDATTEPVAAPEPVTPDPAPADTVDTEPTAPEES